MSGLKVIQAGLLTLVQDAGRFGKHRIGLTTGGALDPIAFQWANRLCSNDWDATALEISFGGLVLEAQIDTAIAVTGAVSCLKINGTEQAQWRTHQVKQGARIEIGFATQGTRAYLAVAGGFNIKPQFESTSTVVREGIGGLQGTALQVGELLPCQSQPNTSLYYLKKQDQPYYSKQVTLRVILGYQHAHFSEVQKRLFFSSEYIVTDRADRMGVRLEGQKVLADIDGILSEGICHGAIQIPADGQPIVLMNDRQTIGGYPKIGSVMSLDTAKLAQLSSGSTVSFESISVEDAQCEQQLANLRFKNTQLMPV